MQLEDIVTSRKLSQEFDELCKEKGITLPETLFGWIFIRGCGEWFLWREHDRGCHSGEWVNGFTTSELLARMPVGFVEEKYIDRLIIMKHYNCETNDEYSVGYCPINSEDKIEITVNQWRILGGYKSPKVSDALLKLAIYLIENDLWQPE